MKTRIRLIEAVVLVGMFGVAPESGAAASAFAQYYAVCADSHGTTGWYGPTRNSYSDAQRDANNHKRDNPGHDPQVVSLSSNLGVSKSVAFCLTGSWSYDFSASVRCSDGVCRFESGAGVVFAPDKQAAELEAKAKVQRELSDQGKTILSLDLKLKIPFLRTAGMRREVETTPMLAFAEGAAVRYPAHFVYDFEAYDSGRFVDSMHWETDAVNEQQLLQLMTNAQSGFARRLNDRHLSWNRISPIFRSSRPL
jgi:hypothetical protein